MWHRPSDCATHGLNNLIKFFKQRQSRNFSRRKQSTKVAQRRRCAGVNLAFRRARKLSDGPADLHIANQKIDIETNSFLLVFELQQIKVFGSQKDLRD